MAKVLYPELSVELIDLTAPKAAALLGGDKYEETFIRTAASKGDERQAAIKELFTPGMDSLNRHNRPWSKPLSVRYSEQMLEGRWATQLPIVVYRDKHGRLHNGQHSCKGLMMAELERLRIPDFYAENYNVNDIVKVKCVVVSGINPDDANLLDVGKTRTHGDVIFRMGLFKDPKLAESTATLKTLARWLATAAKIVYFRTCLAPACKVRSPGKFEHSTMLQVLDAHPGLQESAETVFRANVESERQLSKLISAPYVVAAHYLAWHSKVHADTNSGMRRKQADAFVDAIANGTAKEKGEAYHEMREYFISVKGSGEAAGNEALNRVYDALVVGWNGKLAKETLSKKSFTSIKPDDFPCMGGLDTPLELPEDEEAAEAAEEDNGETADDTPEGDDEE